MKVSSSKNEKESEENASINPNHSIDTSKDSSLGKDDAETAAAEGQPSVNKDPGIAASVPRADGCNDTNGADCTTASEDDSYGERKMLSIGDRCEVAWRDGTFKVAEIIEKRSVFERRLSRDAAMKKDQKKKKHPETNSSDNNPSETLSMEYYVHYVNFDRRLDEWVTLDRFNLTTLNTAGSSDHNSTLHHHSSAVASSSAPATMANTAASASGRTTRRGEKRKHSLLASAPASTVQRSSEDSTACNNSAVTVPSTTTTSQQIVSLADLEREHHEITKIKNIDSIVMGQYQVATWYFSPFPKEYEACRKLFVCEFCLKYMRHSKTLKIHCASCAARSPPGYEIYRDTNTNLSVFEVDGKDNRIYCQNLCLLAKLFLDHKTLYYDVDPFLFYVITQVDHTGAHIVGYFSKEKVSAEDYNLACILTFPQYQKCGYGTFIISLSYELSKRENKIGSPEKPLSDLGKISYRSYWTFVLMNFFSQTNAKENLGVAEISKRTAIKTEDIISTLQSLGMVQSWKGQHVVHVKHEIIQNYMKQK